LLQNTNLISRKKSWASYV